MIEEIEIKIWGEVAGYAAYRGGRLVSFEYDTKFPSIYELAPLMMPRSAVNQAWSFDLNEATYCGLPGLLADSLPDKYGMQMIDLWFAKNGVSLGEVSALDRLCYLGSRAMGALEFHPNHDNKFQNQALDIEKLVDLSAKILRERMSIKSSLDDIATVIHIGSSAGGARAKAVIALNPETLEIRSGQVCYDGFEDWIIKFDGLSGEALQDPLGYTNIEYAYYLMAKDCGIEMTESRLYEEHERYHFLTKRFDRVAEKKLHMQTMCALAHLDYNQPRTASYETLFRIANFLQLSMKEKEQIFRRMVFNVVARNHDDHTKNFSFLMDQSGKWSLAPAYDLIYSYRPDHYWLKEHNLLINGKSKDFVREDLLQVARSFHIKNASDYIDEIVETCSEFKTYAKKAKVSKENMALVSKNILVAF